MTDLITALLPITARVRTDVSAIKKNGKITWTREPLTEERLRQHLDGGPSRGICPIKAGESTTMIGLFDLDSHKGEVSWNDMIEVARNVCAEIVKRGMNPIIWRSSGGMGIHIFILWTEPQDAYSVREFLKSIIGALGYRNGTSGVSKMEIEVFPKQDSVPIGGFGNQFILPLAGQSVPLEPSTFNTMDRAYATIMPWPVSPQVPIVKKQQASTYARPGSIDLEKLHKLLAHINPIVNYDEWIKVGMALHYETNGSDDGL